MFIFGSAANPNTNYGPNRTQCGKCHGARSGMKLHETASALAGKPIFTWEYCPVCGGTGWVHQEPTKPEKIAGIEWRMPADTNGPDVW